MRGTVMLRGHSENECRKKTAGCLLFLRGENKDLAINPLRGLHRARLGLTRRQ